MKSVLIYDNMCNNCTYFALIANKISKGHIRIIGHYSKEGEIFKKIIGEEARKMFWIIVDEYAYGGRYGLIPLIKEVVRGAFSKDMKNNPIKPYCPNRCSIIRIGSLLKGRKIKIGYGFT